MYTYLYTEIHLTSRTKNRVSHVEECCRACDSVFFSFLFRHSLFVLSHYSYLYSFPFSIFLYPTKHTLTQTHALTRSHIFHRFIELFIFYFHFSRLFLFRVSIASISFQTLWIFSLTLHIAFAKLVH